MKYQANAWRQKIGQPSSREIDQGKGNVQGFLVGNEN